LHRVYCFPNCFPVILRDRDVHPLICLVEVDRSFSDHLVHVGLQEHTVAGDLDLVVPVVVTTAGALSLDRDGPTVFEVEYVDLALETNRFGFEVQFVQPVAARRLVLVPCLTLDPLVVPPLRVKEM